MRSQETSEYGSIRIICAQAYYIAGEAVSGRVVLNLERAFPARRLGVRLFGKEALCVFKKSRNTILVNREIILAEAHIDPELDAYLPLMIPEGRHEYEFSIPASTNSKLPSATRYKSAKAVCQVNYALIACLEPFSLTIPALNVSNDLMMLEQFRAASNKAVDRRVAVKCDTKDFGTAMLRVRMDYTGILRPAGFEFYVDYDNSDCLKPLKEIVVRITQKMCIYIDPKAKALREEKPVGEWRLSGIPRGDKKFFNTRLQFSTQNDACLETCNGVNFRKSYSLTVEPIYEGWRANSKSVVEFEVALTNEVQSRKMLSCAEEEEEKQKRAEEGKNGDNEDPGGRESAAGTEELRREPTTTTRPDDAAAAEGSFVAT